MPAALSFHHSPGMEHSKFAGVDYPERQRGHRTRHALPDPSFVAEALTSVKYGGNFEEPPSVCLGSDFAEVAPNA